MRDSDCMHVIGFTMGNTSEEDMVVIKWTCTEGITPHMLLPREVCYEIGMAMMTQSASGNKQ